MQRQGSDPGDTAADGGDGTGGGRLQRLPGGGQPAAPSPAVRLVREYKGPTVSELLQDGSSRALPGRVRSAHHLLERGEYAAAEQRLDDTGGRVLTGHFRPRRRRRPWWLAFAVLLAAVLLAAWACR